MIDAASRVSYDGLYSSAINLKKETAPIRTEIISGDVQKIRKDISFIIY